MVSVLPVEAISIQIEKTINSNVLYYFFKRMLIKTTVWSRDLFYTKPIYVNVFMSFFIKTKISHFI